VAVKEEEALSFFSIMASEKMDLITVNNFLVGLRKQIARSRVQVINKLSR
jgi:hypothetical protein